MHVRFGFLVALFSLLCGCGKGGFPGAIIPPARVPAPPAPPKVVKVAPRPLVEAAPTVEAAPVQAAPPEPEPVAEIPVELTLQLQALGARVSTRPNGHGIDIRNKAGFTDRDIELIAKCPQVVDLTLENVPITDEGMQKLAGLKLTRLILNGCPIGSEGIKTLAGLPLRDTLLSIGLRGTKVTDADLMTMQSFANLERLDASKTAVTDAGLTALETLPLKVLRVADTAVTDAGVQQLQKKRPALVVER